MLSRLPKRKRKIFLTIVPIVFFVLLVTAMLLSQDNNESVHIRNGATNGITSMLSRELPDDVPAVSFKNVTDRAGIRFTHFSHERGSKIAEDMGSGVAWIDYNNNGWQDLFIVNYSGPITMSDDELKNSPASGKLFHNNGDGTFTDVSEESGLALKSRGMATAWADYNNDGWIDCLVTTFGENVLFRNSGDGTFTNVSKEAGFNEEKGFWAGAAWGDFNLDGYIDLYITGYVDFFEIPQGDEFHDVQEPPSINPSVFEPVRNLLYRNNGDGTFTEIAEEAGVVNPDGRSLQAIWIDIDNNRFPDLYVANDVSDNIFFKNVGDGTFMNISHSAKVADYRGSMGLAAGDWDGDEDMDLFITHWIAQENAFYNNLMNDSGNEGMIFFSDDADRLGLGQSSLSYVGWATFFFDFDNDTRPDLFVANGHTNQNLDNPSELVGMNDQLYWNKNNAEGFFEISSFAGNYFDEKFVGRGGAYADYNNNGLLDLVIVNHNGPAILLENQTEVNHNWLQVSLSGTISNRSAIGTKVRLITPSGVQIREVGSQRSYLSQNSLVQHFGLKGDTVADTLEIIWPSGQKQIFTNVPANQQINITEGTDDIIP